MRFVKMHGIGNDYVYVDGWRHPSCDWATIARLVSDRHFGIGSDGLIAVCPPEDPGADVRMRMFNADGSEGETCGNGIRCVAKFAVDRGIVSANPLRIETGRGVLEVAWRRGRDGRVAEASVGMGAPILGHARIPARIEGLADDATVVAHPIDLDRWSAGGGRIGSDPRASWWRDAGVEPHLTLVSMGNPHAVLCCSDPAKVPLGEIGPRIERDPWFPARINVHFVRFGPDGTTAVMRTFERGSGITLACGTGASAVCVAGVLLGRGARRLEARLPGGTLSLEWPEREGEGEGAAAADAAASRGVRMTGPATEVFEGEIDLEAVTGARMEASHA